MGPLTPVVVTRRTRETAITVMILRGDGGPAADGGVAMRVDTSVPFLDHMLATFARYSGFAINVAAKGDLRHHLVEDVAIAVGAAVAHMVPEAATRFGERTVPMDDALVQAVVDCGGRAYYRGPLPSTLYEHWMRSFADAARVTLHLRVLRGRDRHHVVEAAFKALGLALRDAARGTDAVFSTKGAVALEVR